jgi:hypothetical protein
VQQARLVSSRGALGIRLYFTPAALCTCTGARAALTPALSLHQLSPFVSVLLQNLLVMRWANPLFGAWWNRHYVNNVQISFKEDFGTQVGPLAGSTCRTCTAPSVHYAGVMGKGHIQQGSTNCIMQACFPQGRAQHELCDVQQLLLTCVTMCWMMLCQHRLDSTAVSRPIRLAVQSRTLCRCCCGCL